MVFAFVSGHFERRVYKREAISCAYQEFMAKTPAPCRPFQGGQKFDVGIVADLIVRKCADSMPLHRLRKAYRRQKIAISESGLARIFLEESQHLKIVWERIRKLLAKQELVLAGEIPVNLTNDPDRVEGKCKLGYMWVFLAPEILLFAYFFNVSRSSQTPAQILGGSKGTLVVDVYA
ncbi:MAG: transposase [Planctomycetota bacterium]|nr:transposase [Planctomycetota bacterium]